MAKIEFFPVGNGDMTLITLENKKTILIDCNIRKVTDDIPDVKEILRERLERTSNSTKQLYVDAFIWTHPDTDHCLGIQDVFHLGAPENWNKEDDKILIRELWSSPMVFKRASKNLTLSSDAKALNKEAKRRVNKFREGQKSDGNYQAVIGNKVTIICHGSDKAKTMDIVKIVKPLDTQFSKFSDEIDIRVLGPADTSDLDSEEVNLGKNHSSIILNFTFKDTTGKGIGNFLTGGDAEVVCWEHLWNRLNKKSSLEWLSYDVLQTPHHCSWHSLSHESWSKTGGKAKISDDAYSALSQCKNEAFIVSSSNQIKDDTNNPPCIGAKRQYIKMLGADEKTGTFKCIADIKLEKKNIPLVLEITKTGVKDITETGALAKTDDPKQGQNKQGRRYA